MFTALRARLVAETVTVKPLRGSLYSGKVRYIIMETIISKLAEDEKLLWSGGCKRGIKTLDKVQRPVFWRRVLIGAVIFIAITAFYIYKCTGENATMQLSYGIIALFLASCAVAPLTIIMDASKVRRLVYAATDRRLLIFGDKLLDMPYERITQACVKMDPEGNETLFCGTDCDKLQPEKWRYAAFIGGPATEMDGGPCQRFVMYSVDDMAGLKKAIADKIDL